MSSCCVKFQHFGMDCNLQLLLMEIDLNEEENTETNKFINFSIREYVDEIRNKNPEKCWPFKSLGDYQKKVVSSYQSAESTFFSGQNCVSDINVDSKDTTELTESPKLSKVENFNGKDDLPEPTTDKIEPLGKTVDNGSSELTYFKVKIGQNRHENNVDEDAKIGKNVTVANSKPGRNQLRRKNPKFRLLTDIYNDPASELRAGCDKTKIENVNKRFVTVIEDELDDDVTLAAYFRKQKGIEVDDLTLKKRNIIGIEEPSFDPDQKSNSGSKDSIKKDSNINTSRKKIRIDEIDTQTLLENKKDFRLQCSDKSNEFAEVSCKEVAEKEKEKENEDSEMQAVMLLARHFNEEKHILRDVETNTTCACVKKKILKHSTKSGKKINIKTSSKTATKHPVKKITKQKLETAFSSIKMRSFMPVKVTHAGGYKSRLEMSMMKANGVKLDAKKYATLVCSFSMNPADFSIPNGENKFMRGG